MKTITPFFLWFILLLTPFTLLNAQPPKDYVVNSHLDPMLSNHAIPSTINREELTLREAIIYANCDMTDSKITFAPGLQSISLNSPLPPLTEAGTSIDGIDTLKDVKEDLLIVIDGKKIKEAIGFQIQNHNCSIQGLIIQNFRIGIQLGKNSTTVLDTIKNIQIGGVGKGNLIRTIYFSYDSAIHFESAISAYACSDLRIQGNTIDCRAGYPPSSPEHILSAIKIRHSQGLVIGGQASEEGNSISVGSSHLIGTEVIRYFGIYLANTKYTHIQHNVIDGYQDSTYGRQGRATGVFLTGEQNHFISIFENSITNCGDGIMEENNFLVHLKQNKIYHNLNSGIRRYRKNQLTPPVIKTVSRSAIEGEALPKTKIEVFVDQYLEDPCQGETYLGGAMTDKNGRWVVKNFSVKKLLEGKRVSATASFLQNLKPNSFYNTSDFSNCVEIDTYNDEYTNAREIPVRTNPCALNYVSSDLGKASVSIPKGYQDATDYQVGDHKDVWFKVVIPQDGRLVIKQSNDTEIHTHIDIWQGEFTDKLPLNRLKNSLDTLYQGLPYHILEEPLVKGDILFIRVWDENDSLTNTVRLAAHMILDDNPGGVLCEEGGAEFVRNQFIVVYNDTTTRKSIDRVTADLKERGAGEPIDHFYCDSFNIQLWQVNDITELETCQQVAAAAIEVDTTNLNFLFSQTLCDGYGEVLDFSPPVGRSSIRPSEAIRVAIIDSGVDLENPFLEPFLERPSIKHEDSLCNSQVAANVNFVHEDIPPADSIGHGTAVAGAIINKLPSNINLDLISLKAFNGRKGTLFDMLEAITYATHINADIINISGGFERDTIPSILQLVLKKAEKKDILIVTSAGNLGRDLDDPHYNKWPASAGSSINTIDTNTISTIITVGSYFENTFENKLIRAYFSNYGKSVDILAHGLVQTTALGAVNGRRLQSVGGTSISTPIITQLAIIKKRATPSLKGSSLKEAVLRISGDPIGDDIRISEELSNYKFIYKGSVQQAPKVPPSGDSGSSGAPRPQVTTDLNQQ